MGIASWVKLYKQHVHYFGYFIQYGFLLAVLTNVVRTASLGALPYFSISGAEYVPVYPGAPVAYEAKSEGWRYLNWRATAQITGASAIDVLQTASVAFR